MKTIQSRVIQGMVMPGGWHVLVKTARGETRIDADTLPDLVVALNRYRIDNGQPLGDPLKDIEEYICTKFPHQCHQVPGAVVTVEVREVKSSRRQLLDRIIGWFEGQMSKLDISQLVLDMDAQRRASVCEKCPFNQEWTIGCSDCKANIDRLTQLVRQGRRLTRDRKLKGCSVLGHENRAAVFLRRERLGDSDQLPEHCWLRTEPK